MAFEGIKFAPINVPLDRRLQTLAALLWICIPTLIPLITWACIFYVMAYTRYYYLPMLYCIFWYLDVGQQERGGRSFAFIRNLFCWKWLNDYFPLTVIKTCDYPPDRNYLFCFHPHGILTANAISHFTANGTDFPKMYPGLTRFFSTLDLHFRTPLCRDFMMALGVISSSKKSLMHVLNPKNKGNAVCLIVGGAQEAMYAKPGSTQIVLHKRRGFVKIALRTGASLVPVYAFGENDLYDQMANPPGSWLHSFQEWFKCKTGLAPVIPIGRGLFQYTFGIIPRRKPIQTVFGEPIEVPLEAEPSEASIIKYHKLYEQKLIALFEEHKHKHIENAESVHLEIVE